MLLIAFTINGYNEILPFTWAVVLIKDEENWIWFLQLLKDCILGIDALGITIISDWNKELQKAVFKILLKAYHSYYYQYLTSNIQTSHGLAY